MASRRVTCGLAYAWVVVLSVAVLGPALMPGFALSYDLIFTPRQDLLPTSIGVGGGLPRAVPQDAVVALLERVLPGSIVEKIALLAVPLLVGTGMLRLLGSATAGVIGATFAIANPFVAQRLVIGHWGFLLAYALVPWALVLARRLRERGDPWDGLRLLLVVAAGSLTPSGSLLLAVSAVPPVLLPGSALAPRGRALLAAVTPVTWLPWLVPALLHPAVAAADPAGSDIFSLRADTPGGVVITALTGGGIWNAEVVLPSRATALSWVLVLVTLALAVLGLRRLWRDLCPGVAWWWAGLAGVGLLAAVSSALLAGPWSTLIEAVPGAGLARDAQKLLAPWVLFLAAAAGAGGAWLAQRSREQSVGIVVTGALVVLPLACQPDMLAGVGGRLTSVDYPSDWATVRDVLGSDERPGDVASFPWTAFRRFAWNDQRTMLDPAPRWLPRPTVVADGLDVATSGGVVTVAGDDPRARVIYEALGAGEPVGQVLPRLGIGWALVASGTPGPVPDLMGWTLVVDGADLDLYAAPVSREVAQSPDDHLALVALVDLAVLLGLLSGAVLLGFRRVRARRPGPLVP